MSSSHELEFLPKGLLKPNSSTPGTEVYLPQLGQPVKRPGYTPTPETDHPTATATRRATEKPTATPEPSKTATAPATETPKPTETPPAKEVLWLTKDTRAYDVDAPADPYSPSKRLAKLTRSTAEQIRLVVNPEDKDTGWIMSGDTPVAYRFAYSEYGIEPSPTGPQQEPIILEVRIEDLISSGLLDKLPDPKDQVFTGTRIIRKVNARGAGLSAKAKEIVAHGNIESRVIQMTAQELPTVSGNVAKSGHEKAGSQIRFQTQIEMGLATPQGIQNDLVDQLNPQTMTAIGLASGAARLFSEEQPQIDRRQLLKWGGRLLAGTMLSRFLGGNSADSAVAATPDSEPEPITGTPFNPNLLAFPLMDPVFEMPPREAFTFRGVIESKEIEFTSALVNCAPSLTDVPNAIILKRDSSGEFYVRIIENDTETNYHLKMSNYVPSHKDTIEYSFELNGARDQLVLSIFDSNGAHQCTLPVSDGIMTQSLMQYTRVTDPRSTAMYSDVEFKADPDRLSQVKTPEPPQRLKEIDELNYRQEAIKPEPDRDLWMTSLGITGLSGIDSRMFAADWLSAADTDGAKNILFDPYREQPDEKEAALYLLNISNNIPYRVSIYGYNELDARLEERDGRMLRIVELDTLPDGAKSSEVSSYLTALQLGRTPESRINLALRGFFDSSGQISKKVRVLGNVAELPAKLKLTTPSGTRFDHTFMLGNVELTDGYVQKLAVTVGALIKAGLPSPTLIANSVPPDGISAASHIEGRHKLVAAMKNLGVTVGSENVQKGDVPFADEVDLNGPENNPRNMPAPTIIAPASRVGTTHTREPYTFVTGGGLVLDQAAYAELLAS